MAKKSMISSGRKRPAKLSNNKKRQIREWVHEAEKTFFGDALVQAEERCNKILEVDSTNGDALTLLGKIAVKQGDNDRALELFLKGIESNPRHLNLIGELAQYYHNIGDSAASVNYWLQYIKQKPYNPAVWHFLSLAYSGNLQLDKAMDAVKHAQKLAPKEAAFYVTEGYILEMQCKHDEWICCMQKAVELQPNNGRYLDYLSQAYMSVGRNEEAEEILRVLLDDNPSYAPAYYFLLRRSKVTSYNDDMKKTEELLAGDSISDDERQSLLFALGKGWEDLEEYDKAFASYDAANKLKRDLVNFDIDRACQYVETVKSIFTKEFIEQHRADNQDGEGFIFVVGMPRSGSTLISRILSVHPNSFDIGEPNIFRETIGKFTTGNKNITDLKKIADITADQLVELKAMFLEMIEKIYGRHELYIDKTLHNFLVVGLIYMLFPKAKIIHSARHSLDTCWSIFANNFFGHEFNYAYSLEEIGRFYHSYEALMEHWREVLPEGAFYDATNEDFVADPEQETRKLIEYCGLDWDDAYLNFHTSKKAVRTLSLPQIRKPINSSSVERSNRFEKYLEPLKEAMK